VTAVVVLTGGDEEVEAAVGAYRSAGQLHSAKRQPMC